jgi:phage recombination protein Bet
MAATPHDLKLGEIVVQSPNGATITYDEDMKEVLKQTVAKNATDAELFMFAKVAAKYDLDPFAREIWFIKYQKGTDIETRIETSRDGYLKIAKKEPGFKGVQSFAVYEEDVFEVEIEGAKVKNVIHKFNGFERGKIRGAWAVAEKEGQRPVYAVVPFDEYYQPTKSGKKGVWDTHSSAMIKKVAEVDVLKRIAGISGMVTDAEMNSPGPELSPMAEKKLNSAKCEIITDPDMEKKDVINAEFTTKHEIEDITPTPELSETEKTELRNASGLFKALINNLEKENHPVTKESIIIEADNDDRIHPDDKKKIIEIING